MGNAREYKSSVFSMLLQEQHNALELYNALNHSDYENPEAVEIVTLENGISLSVRNDAAFIVEQDICFFEHQSTYNPNMPLRGLFYYVDTIRKQVGNRDLYSRRRIPVLPPSFVVFYNGRETRPEKEVQYLSDLYVKETEEPSLELVCTVYNINKEYNQDFMRECRFLREYMVFVDKVREYTDKGRGVEEAVEGAVGFCISNHVLEDFLRRRGAEVLKVMALDYTWERREELIRQEEREEGREEGLKEGREEGREEGLQEGRKEGLQEGRKEGLKEGRKEGLQEGRKEGNEEGEKKHLIIQVYKKIRRGRSREQIADDLEEDEMTIQPIYELLLEVDGELDVDSVYGMLNESLP